MPLAVRVQNPNHWTTREFPQIFVFHSSGSWKPEIRAPAWLGSWWRPASLITHKKREREAEGELHVYKGINPIMRVSTS